MKKIILLFTFTMAVITIQAQDVNTSLVIGDTFTIGEASGSSYKHLDFPKKNIIIKRGSIANFKALEGKSVIVSSIDTDKNGDTQVMLTRQDGLKFFRFYKSVDANLDKAIASGELKPKKKIRAESIALP